MGFLGVALAEIGLGLGGRMDGRRRLEVGEPLFEGLKIGQVEPDGPDPRDLNSLGTIGAPDFPFLAGLLAEGPA